MKNAKAIASENRYLISDKHILLTASDAVSQLCQPLFTSTQLAFFELTRIYKDGSASELSSRGVITKHIYENGYYMLPLIPKQLIDNLHFYFLSSDQNICPFMTTLRDIFNVDNVFLLFDKYKNYTDIYTYRTAPHFKQSVNYYLNNIDMLMKFGRYFKEKSDTLMQLSIKDKIIPITPMLKQRNIDIVNSFNENDLYNDYKNINYHQFITKLLKPSFTKREMHVFQYLLSGYSAKDTAKELSLSVRTIETHLDHIKSKLGCRYKRDIIKLALNQPGLFSHHE